ncbi:hypothetical protein GCM10022252_45440 [Streptosporangium oxazolinicum]|uniref:Uncharacterized protein n=1 Tax=Streptosporangium oxazolinicum TaxID=909287 RepID=A0ABP8B3Q4_9ACTN
MDTQGHSYYSTQLSRARVLSSNGHGQAEPHREIRVIQTVLGHFRFTGIAASAVLSVPIGIRVNHIGTASHV